MEVLAFDWDTGDFIRDVSYLTRCTFPDVEVDVVTKEEFDRQIALQRRWHFGYYCRCVSSGFRWLRKRVTPGH